MDRELKIPELAIVVAAHNHNPTVLNPDFLRYNDIVPQDWILRGDPISTPVLSQVAYDEHVGIAAQSDKVVFTRSNGDIRRQKSPDIAELTTRYVNTLPHVEYTTLGINVQGHAVVIDGMEAAKREIIDRYVASGPWAQFEQGLDEATISLTYQLSRGALRVTVGPAFYTKQDENQDQEDPPPGEPVIHFEGNFQMDIQGEDRQDRLKDLCELLANWQDQLHIYIDLVENMLLNDAS